MFADLQINYQKEKYSKLSEINNGFRIEEIKNFYVNNCPLGTSYENFGSTIIYFII